MRLGDTIIARSSPPGRSARALVRLSGPLAHQAVDALSAPGRATAAVSGPLAAARTAAVHLRLSERARLPVLSTRWFAPRSATGEPICEVLVPGNPTLVERVIRALISGVAGVGGGVRRAEPGEFTARAFMNGRLDLVQAEGIARTIAARSESERLAAARLTTGEAGARVRRWSDEIATLLALTEAGIDFSDHEDVVAIEPAALSRRVEALSSEFDSALTGAGAREHREHRARVVLVGRANAGKSTLFNALLGRGRAVVSDRAGSTRDVLVEELDLSGDRPGAGVIELCDVAGVVEEPGGGGRQSQEAARAAIEGCDAMVLCDAQGEFELLEAGLPAGSRETPRLRVRTKADLPSTVSHDNRVLGVCALDGFGLSALRRRLADVTSEPTRTEADALPRHAAAMAAAREALVRAGARVDGSRRGLASAEMVAAYLREALDAIGSITGRTTTEEILGRVFAAFCVGK